MNLEQLEAINAIVEKGSFRAAAEHLNRSQPSLSTSIKNLEEEFGILIFDREEYRPKLTEVGAVFLNASKAALDAAHYVSRIGVELGRNKAETKLRISVDPLVSIEAIELIAQECARSVVPVNLIIDKSILKGSYQGLLSGEVDLALAPSPQHGEKIEKIVIDKVALVGVVSRKLLQEKNRPTEETLKKHAQILVYDKNIDEEPNDRLPKALHEGGGPKIFVPDHFTKLRLIEGGLGWGRISKAEFEASKGLVLIEEKLCESFELELCILRPKHRPIGPIARLIWNVFEQRHQQKK